MHRHWTAWEKTDEAIAELESVRASSPKEPVLHFELAYLYYKKRDYERAKPEFNLEATNNPGYAQTYFYLGDIALNEGEDEAAEPLLKKALQLQKDMRQAYVDLGAIYARQDKNREALAALQHAVQLDPLQPDAHYRLGRLYTVMGEKKKAQLEFETIKTLHAKTDDSLIEKISGNASGNTPK